MAIHPRARSLRSSAAAIHHLALCPSSSAVEIARSALPRAKESRPRWRGEGAASIIARELRHQEHSMASLADIPRPSMSAIAGKIHASLIARAAAGPPEPALDAFIPLVAGVTAHLATQVSTKTAAGGAKSALVVAAEKADDLVDRWYRHVFHYVEVEGLRRFGPAHVAAAALEAAAFPEGLGHIDDQIPDENARCREALGVLRDPTDAAALLAMEFPLAWLDRWASALDASDAAVRAVEEARSTVGTAVALGVEAEADFVDVMARLNDYVRSRAGRTETAKRAAGAALIEPLAEAVRLLRVNAKARKTRADNDAKTPVLPVDAPPAVAKTPVG
jgi:hypothetical protein